MSFKMLDLFVNSAKLTLVLTPPEFQPFRRTFPSNFKFIGTTIKDRLKDSDTPYDDYDVYLSMGSIFTENMGALEAFLTNDFVNGKKVIVTCGNVSFGEEYPNAELVNRTDQLSLLPHVDTFINHGGLNSVYESIYLGRFQVMYPLQEEQRMTAIIAARKKTGLYIKNPAKLTEKLVLESREKCRDGIEKYSEIFASYDAAAEAVRLIKEYC